MRPAQLDGVPPPDDCQPALHQLTYDMVYDSQVGTFDPLPKADHKMVSLNVERIKYDDPASFTVPSRLASPRPDRRGLLLPLSVQELVN